MYFNIFLYTHTHHCSVWYCVILYSYIIMHELHTELHCSVQMCSQGTVPWELQLDLCSGVSITAVNTRGYVHGRTCMCMYGCGCRAVCLWGCVCLCVSGCVCVSVSAHRCRGWVDVVEPPRGVAAPAAPLKAGLSWGDLGERHPLRPTRTPTRTLC